MCYHVCVCLCAYACVQCVARAHVYLCVRVLFAARKYVHENLYLYASVHKS